MPIVLAASSLVDVRPGLIFWTLVTFILVALLLRRVAWGPILKVVDEREKTIAASIESAKRERAEAERLLAEQKEAIQKARAEAAEMMRRNTEDVEKLRTELVAKARAGTTATRAVQEGVQMHGGMGMTDQFDIGFFMKRARVCEELFGDANYHTEQLARARGY